MVTVSLSLFAQGKISMQNDSAHLLYFSNYGYGEIGPTWAGQLVSNKGGQLVNGATNSSLVFPSLQINDAGLYSVVVTSPYGSITNTPAQLVVNPANISLGLNAGITIEECASISRRLGGQMDESDFFGESPFTLEVSSPGVDFPLTFTRQYIRNIGRQITVTMVDGTIRKGRLESVADDQIVLDIEPEKVSKSKKKKDGLSVADVPAGPTPISFTQIKKANVDVSFK